MDTQALTIKLLQTRNDWLEACLAAALDELRVMGADRILFDTPQSNLRGGKTKWLRFRTDVSGHHKNGATS